MANEDLDENIPVDAPLIPTSDDEDVETADQEPLEQEAGAEGEDDESPDDDGDEDSDEEFDEVEVAGKKYSVPKALKDEITQGYLRQADYTRKAQTVAEERRDVEERQKAFEQQTETQKQNLENYAKVQAMEGTIAQYERVDWTKYEEDDPLAAQSHWRRFSDLKEQRRDAVDSLRKAEFEQSQKAQHEYAKRVEDTTRTVMRDIKNWSPDLAKKLTDYALTIGFTQQEIVSQLNTDARQIKVLHQAYLADQIEKQQKKQKPRTTATESQAAIKPLTQVSKRSSRPAASPMPSDKDSDDDWLKKREAELRRKQRA